MSDQIGLCKYRDIFGKVNEGVHQYKVFGNAVVDTALTVLAGVVLARWRGWNPFVTIAGLIILGIIVHRLFCVNTALNRALGLSVSASK